MLTRSFILRNHALMLVTTMLLTLAGCAFAPSAPQQPSKLSVEIQVNARKLIVRSPGKENAYPIAHFGRSIIGCDGTVKCMEHCVRKLPQAGVYADGRAVKAYRTSVSNIQLGNVLLFGNEFIVMESRYTASSTCGNIALEPADFEKFFSDIAGERGIAVTVR